MKNHVMNAGDARHHMVRLIMGKIRCCYCGDDARDALVLAERQNTEIRYASETPSSESSTPRSESPLPVSRDDNGLRPGADIKPTPERREDDELMRNLVTEPNRATNSTLASLDPPCTEVGSEKGKQLRNELVVGQTDHSSPLSQKSCRGPEPTTPTEHGTFGRSARETGQRTAQPDVTIDLSAVRETTDKAPSSALLPNFDHASDMEILPIRHSSLFQKQEGTTHTSSPIPRDGFDKRSYHGIGVNGALSGLSNTSNYPPSYRSFNLNGRGYTSQGTFLDSHNDPNTWQSTSYFSYPAGHYHNWLAASEGPISNSSYVQDCSNIKVEDPTSSYGLVDYPRHSTALANNQYSMYNLHHQPVSTNSLMHDHTPVRSLNNTTATNTTFSEGTGDQDDIDGHRLRFNPLIRTEEATTTRTLCTQ